MKSRLRNHDRMKTLLAAALVAAVFVPETGTPMYHEFARCVWQLEPTDNDGFFWCYARYLDSLDDYNRWKDRQ